MNGIKKYTIEQLNRVKQVLNDTEIKHLMGGYQLLDGYYVFTVEEISQYYPNGNIPTEFEHWCNLDSLSEDLTQFSFTHYYRISESDYESLYGSNDIWDVVDPSNSSNDIEFDNPSEWYSSEPGDSDEETSTSPADSSTGSSSNNQGNPNSYPSVNAIVNSLKFQLYSISPKTEEQCSELFRERVRASFNIIANHIRNKIDDVNITFNRLDLSGGLIELIVFDYLDNNEIAHKYYDFVNETVQ